MPEKQATFLALPGQSFGWGPIEGTVMATLTGRTVNVGTSAVGWDDLNRCWINALNAYEQGLITHFSMLHSDIGPEHGWLDKLLDELERLDADLISVPSPLKDGRGLVSSGIGDHRTRWHPFRRFTVRELHAHRLWGQDQDFPETFNAADVGYADYPLLHNSGCWACDLRKDVFRATDDAGFLKCVFNFPITASKGPDGQWISMRESEDWYFSRELHDLGAKTYITTKVQLLHYSGGEAYANHGAWGTYEHGDEQTRGKWDTSLEEAPLEASEAAA